MTKSFKKPKITVDETDHFANDMLDRRPAVENLSLLLSNITSPIVLSVNGPWGSGKTTFLEMLHADLKSKKFRSIYFSAWETDFATDPLLAFLGEINTALEGYLKGDKAQSKAWAQAKKAGVQILKRALPVLVKVGTAGLVDADKLVEGEAAKLAETFSKDAINEYLENKEAIQDFKRNIAKVLTDSEGKKSNLYIFVDELDRCRPTYSIELLERVKHLLDVEGLIFVMAMDRQQLAHSIKGIYGVDFDALGYLKRFIDIEYSLPKPNIGNFVEAACAAFGFVEFFAKRTHQSLEYDSDHLKQAIVLLSEANQLSLRSVEQLLAKVNLVLLSTKVNHYLYPALVVFLLLVKELSPTSYERYIKVTEGPGDMVTVLQSMFSDYNSRMSFTCALIEGMLISAKVVDAKSQCVERLQYHSSAVMDDVLSSIVRTYSETVLAVVKESGGGFRGGIDLNQIIPKIEMIAQFEFGADTPA